MILSVNANAAIDHVLFVDSLEPRGTIRAARAVNCIGGKGADIALVLSRLGAPHLLVSFMAGHSGQLLERLYQEHQIQSDLLWVEGETRVVTVIIETYNACLTQISHPGYRVSAADCQQFFACIEGHAAQADWVVAAGSLPAGAPADFYAQICERVHRAGGKMLIDCTGKVLLETLPYHPEIIKFNRSEYEDTFHVRSDSLADTIAHVQSLIAGYQLQAVVVTLGHEGILLVLPDSALLASGPQMQPVNAAGAGDAVSAVIAYRLSIGDSWEDALRWSCAAGAAAVTTEITADCSLETILSILPQVQVRSAMDLSF